MVAALAAGLRRKGHDVRVVLPLYRQVKDSVIELHTALPSMCVAMGIGEVWCAVRYTVTSEKIPLYFIEYEVFFTGQASIMINSIKTTQTIPCGSVFSAEPLCN